MNNRQLFQVGERVVTCNHTNPDFNGVIGVVESAKYAKARDLSGSVGDPSWYYGLDANLPAKVTQSKLRRYISPTQLVNSFSEMLHTLKGVSA